RRAPRVRGSTRPPTPPTQLCAQARAANRPHAGGRDTICRNTCGRILFCAAGVPFSSAQSGVDLRERSAAWAQVGGGKAVERRGGGLEVLVQVLRVGVDVEQARDDL